MRFTDSLAATTVILVFAAALPAVSAEMNKSAERLTAPSAAPTWDISKLRELDDKADVRDRHGLTPEQIKGMDLVNVAGDRIGSIDDVLAGSDGEIVAVTVDVGGFLGIGGREVVVGVDRLELRRDQFATAMRSKELSQQPEWNQ